MRRDRQEEDEQTDTITEAETDVTTGGTEKEICLTQLSILQVTWIHAQIHIHPSYKAQTTPEHNSNINGQYILSQNNLLNCGILDQTNQRLFFSSRKPDICKLVLKNILNCL